MNKKGFTLIEILATIAIMGVISVMISFNMVGIFEEKEKITKDNKVNIIENAACVYVELDKNKDLKDNCLALGCDITTDILVHEGLLDEEDVDKLQVIHISKENNEKVCKIKED